MSLFEIWDKNIVRIHILVLSGRRALGPCQAPLVSFFMAASMQRGAAFNTAPRWNPLPTRRLGVKAHTRVKLPCAPPCFLASLGGLELWSGWFHFADAARTMRHAARWLFRGRLFHLRAAPCLSDSATLWKYDGSGCPGRPCVINQSRLFMRCCRRDHKSTAQVLAFSTFRWHRNGHLARAVHSLTATRGREKALALCFES